MKQRRLFFVVAIFMVLLAGILFMCPDVLARKHHSGNKYEPDEAIFTDSQVIDATYANWMAKSKDAIKDLPINRIPLLGSHDAGSCDVDSDSSPSISVGKRF